MPLDKSQKRDLTAFGGNIRRIRITRELSQERLAEMADLNIRTVQKIEAGQLNVLLTTALRIQRSLGCNPSELIPP